MPIDLEKDPQKRADPLTFVVVFPLLIIGLVFLFLFNPSEMGLIPITPLATLDLSSPQFKRSIKVNSTGGSLFSCPNYYTLNF
ncbi:hypothetical protein RCL1_008810 [Eukaryota sp. TZLM3-RCL]